MDDDELTYVYYEYPDGRFGRISEGGGQVPDSATEITEARWDELVAAMDEQAATFQAATLAAETDALKADHDALVSLGLDAGAAARLTGYRASA